MPDTHVALEAADVAVLNNRITDVAVLVRLSRQTTAIIRQNVAVASRRLTGGNKQFFRAASDLNESFGIPKSAGK